MMMMMMMIIIIPWDVRYPFPGCDSCHIFLNFYVKLKSHAAQHMTHNHNQAYSKQRTTHTQKHDMLPQRQFNITK